MGRKRRPIISASAAAAVGLLCAGIPVLSLFYGAATPEGVLAARWLALGASALVLWRLPKVTGAGVLIVPMSCLMFLAALGLLQSVEWSSAVAHGGSQFDSVPPVEVPARRSLSLAPDRSRSVALDLIVLTCLGGCSFLVFGRRKPRRFLVAALVSAGLAHLFVGIRPYLAGKVPRLAGGYVNPDHLATFLLMAAMFAVACFAWAVATKRWSGMPEVRALAVIVTSALLLAALVGLMLTGSRAALIGLAAGVGVQGVALGRTHRLSKVIVSGVVLATFSAAVLIWLGPAHFFSRIGRTTLFDVAWNERTRVWNESLELARTSPLVGTGLGSFRDAYPLVQGTDPSRLTWVKAHNDYVELLVTGGGIGLLIGIVCGASVIGALWRRSGRALRSEERLFAVGALGALAAVAAHSFFDFGLSLWANSFALTVCMAAGLAILPRTNGSDISGAR